MSAGPFDLGAIRRAHGRFLQQHKTLVVDRALTEAGKHAEEHVKNRSTFQRRSASNSLKDAVDSKLIRTAGGALVRIFTKKRPLDTYIEEGTQAHPIVARRARVLRFEVNGQVIFRRRVFHPGTKSYYFLRNATLSATTDMVLRLAGFMREVAARF